MAVLGRRLSKYVAAVAEPGFELSRVEQISTKFFWGKKSYVINKKWSKLMH
jgi:hypothetical protein